MSRTINSRGAEFPAAQPLLKILDTNFQYNAGQPLNGVDLSLWKIWGQPNWHYDEKYFSDNVDNLKPYQSVEIVPTDTGEQTVILSHQRFGQTGANQEFSYLAQPYQFEAIGQDLGFINSDNEFELRCIATPAQFREQALGIVNGYRVIGVSDTTITVEGQGYYRSRQAITGGQARGSYMGISRYLRDELGSGAATIDPWKREKHATGVIALPNGSLTDAQRLVRYTNIVEAPEDPVYVDGMEPTQHTIELSGAMTTEQKPAIGQYINLLHHMPYVSCMPTTYGTFSQKYGVWEIEGQLGDHAEQFGCFWWFLNALEVYSENANKLIKFKQAYKSIEVDGIENPGGNTVFHNTHCPHSTDEDTGQPNGAGMLNYAASNGITPVMSNPEWTQDEMQQHQLGSTLLDPGHADYVSPQSMFKLTVAIWPEDNDVGKTGDSVEWYMTTADGKKKFTAGCVMNRYFNDGVNELDPLAFIFGNPCGGDFISQMNEIYNPGGGTTNTTLPIVTKLKSLKVYGFPGQVAGGAGWPDRFGMYPYGMKPTPGDNTGNSGTGVITQEITPGTETAVLEYINGAPSVGFSRAITLHATGSGPYQWLIPAELSPYIDVLSTSLSGSDLTFRYSSPVPESVTAQITCETAD